MIISFENGRFKKTKSFETPTKPVWEYDRDGNHASPLCPNCKENVLDIFGYDKDGKSVCQCGQHIDWENWEDG